MIMIRTAALILIALALLTAMPPASADDPEPEPSQGPGAAGKCVDVDPWSSNPVGVYDCPATLPP